MIANANSFLSSLSAKSRDVLLSHATAVELPIGAHLYEPATTPRYAYFLLSGLASVVTPTEAGEAAEVTFIGKEGLIGSLHLLGPALLSTRCMMQIAGTALRIPFTDLQRSFETSHDVHSRVLEFVQVQAAATAQIAACNRLHNVEGRLTRWLLMAQDRTGYDMLTFTQEYLAEMISNQRTTVTVVAGKLRRRGLIRYSRGIIHMLDRAGLEAITCSCYPLLKALFTELYQGNREGLNKWHLKCSGDSIPAITSLC